MCCGLCTFCPSIFYSSLCSVLDFIRGPSSVIFTGRGRIQTCKFYYMRYSSGYCICNLHAATLYFSGKEKDGGNIKYSFGLSERCGNLGNGAWRRPPTEKKIVYGREGGRIFSLLSGKKPNKRAIKVPHAGKR